MVISGIQIILYLVLLITVYPIGLFLAKLTREELVSGQIWFKRLMRVFAVIAIMEVIMIVVGYYSVDSLLNLQSLVAGVLAMVYMMGVTKVALIKGRDKGFVKG